MPQTIPYWAITGTIIVPASERGRAKLKWFSQHPTYGRVSTIGHDIIHVIMYDRNDQVVGGSNFWFKDEDP